jgi:glycosyltransferase involved in cell wall biosynthesis
MNAFSQGKSGGDVIFAEVFKRQRLGNHYVVTSLLGKEFCLQMGFNDPFFVITTREKHISNIIYLYIKRILLGIIKSWSLPKPDILYVTSDILPDVLPALALRIKYLFCRKRPLWIQKNYHINQKDRVVSYYAQKISLWLISKLSDLNITCSLKSRDDFVKAGLSSSKMNVVFPGIDLDHIKSVSPSEKGFDGVYLGRLAISKGIYDIVPTWKKVVTVFPDSFPSHEEGFGIVIAEAMACGCVAVAYDLPVYRGIFQNYIAKATCFDKGAFADAVISLLQDKGGLREQAEKGMDLVSRFSWQRASEEEMKLIESVIAKASPIFHEDPLNASWPRRQ